MQQEWVLEGGRFRFRTLEAASDAIDDQIMRHSLAVIEIVIIESSGASGYVEALLCINELERINEGYAKFSGEIVVRNNVGRDASWRVDGDLYAGAECSAVVVAVDR